jgi:MFS family permease
LKSNFTKRVWLLGFISLFTDAASEMLYPIMPLYLNSIGYGMAMIGFLEGLAEAAASISKAYLGKWSDHVGKRVIFVQIGYGLSALSKPLIILSNAFSYITILRVLDRFGKGIRSSARDAILNEESTATNKASIFGFHRSMDTIGAVIGPLVALAILYFKPAQYKILFVVAIIPSLLSIICTQLLKEKPSQQKTKIAKEKTSLFGYWKDSSKTYKQSFMILILFALVNSSDVFLLMHLKEIGFSEVQVLALYIIYNIVLALLAYPLGQFADKFGKQKIIGLGFMVFAFVYACFSLSNNTVIVAIFITLYGLYAAATDGVAKALLLTHSDTSKSATAIGLFSSAQGLASIVASTCMGILWQNGYKDFGFMLSAIIAAVVAVLIYKGGLGGKQNAIR